MSVLGFIWLWAGQIICSSLYYRSFVEPSDWVAVYWPMKDCIFLFANQQIIVYRTEDQPIPVTGRFPAISYAYALWGFGSASTIIEPWISKTHL